MSKKSVPRDIETETRIERSILAPQGAKRFARHGDPLDAWLAIALAPLEEPLPPAVREYLRTAAKRIVAIDGSVEGGTNRAVAEALGVQAQRGGSRFDRLSRTGHDLVIAMKVWEVDFHQPFDAKVQSTYQVAADAHMAQCSQCKRKRLSPKREHDSC
jgi:hypothetical protein